MKNKLVILWLLSCTTSLFSQEPAPEKIDKQFLLGNFEYKKDPLFTEVSTLHAIRPLYLNRQVYAAFIEMYNKAQKDGINLRIISGTRNFQEQRTIWEKKWNASREPDGISKAQMILEYSSMPATSRHHWGTDIDLNNLENSYFESGKGKEEYEWLVCNAADFGFYQVYTSRDSGRTGYAEEKWHWSYLPLAKDYLRAYNRVISYSDITGFEGAELAETNRMITDYVNGISPAPEPGIRLTSLTTEPAIRLTAPLPVKSGN